ncbi:MAG: hypothetical protein HYX46_05210 [Betaproteobacteria bacterium]|nr:hypothetical protein [Betaproteobacteria bacterium]
MSAQTLAAILGIAGALGVAAGAGLLIVPGRTLRERTALRRWLLEIDLIALLDRRKSIERPLYRHHYAFGAAVIVGAVVLLVTLWELRDHSLATGVLSGILGAWGVRAVILTSWALAVFALGIGVFLLIRPSALKGFETAANRWIEPFPSAGKLGGPAAEGIITRLVLRAPRLTALLLLAAGIACLLSLAAIK